MEVLVWIKIGEATLILQFLWVVQSIKIWVVHHYFNWRDIPKKKSWNTWPTNIVHPQGVRTPWVDGEIPVDFVFLSSCHIFLKQQEMLSLRLTRFTHALLMVQPSYAPAFPTFFFLDNSIGKKTGSPEAAFITFGLGSWISINSVGPAQWRSDHFPTPVSMSTRQNKWNPRSICQGKCRISSVMSCRSHGDCP